MPQKPVRVFLIRKNIALAAGALLAAVAIFCAVNVPAAITAAGSARQLPIYCVDRSGEDGKKYCSISFDAAWGNEDTQMLIDILAKYDVKATFFLVGHWVNKYPESVKALHDAGMEVMNHSNHHDHYNSLSAQQIVADVTACNDKVQAITGVAPKLIRCPYGEYDDHVISAIRSMGMEPIQWDVERYHTAQAPAGACLREPNGQRSVRSSWAADPQQQCGHYGIYESGCLCDQSDSRRRY